MKHAPFDKTLNGATVLYVTEHDLGAAERIVALAERQVPIQVTDNAYPGRIYGFKEKAYLPCLMIEIEK